MEENIHSLLFSHDLPFYLKKQNITRELEEIFKITKANLFFNHISIKSILIGGNKNFLTPKFEIVFRNLSFETLLTKELVEMYKSILNEYDCLGNFLFLIISETLYNLFSLEYCYNKIKLISYFDKLLDFILAFINKKSITLREENIILPNDSFYQDPKYQTLFKIIFKKLSKDKNPIYKFHLESFKLFNKVQISSDFENIEYFSTYEGLILKTKLSQEFEKSIFKYNKSLNNNILSTLEISIENIFIYKSNKIFDIETINDILGKERIINNENSYEKNDRILMFLQNIIEKNNVNTLFFIGCELDSSIKNILQSFEIYYFEWLNWRNYQVNIFLI